MADSKSGGAAGTAEIVSANRSTAGWNVANANRRAIRNADSLRKGGKTRTRASIQATCSQTRAEAGREPMDGAIQRGETEIAAAHGIGSPLSRFPSGESRGGRVPPTPRTLPASKQRWHASMLRLPPQEGFQTAPLKSPLRIPLPAAQAGFQMITEVCGLLIQTSVGARSGWGGLRTKRSG